MFPNWRIISFLFAVASTRPLTGCEAFIPPCTSLHRSSRIIPLASLKSSPNAEDLPWNGEVVANTNDGKIRGCSVTPVGGPPTVEWEITIDGYVRVHWSAIEVFQSCSCDVAG